jgi:hypothetical protein
VQPDKRPWGRQLAESGGTLTERYRVGRWTLVAAEREIRPHSYAIRSDRPGFPGWYAVWHAPHDGWCVADGDATYSSHESPLQCLEWWAARQDRSSHNAS